MMKKTALLPATLLFCLFAAPAVGAPLDGRWNITEMARRPVTAAEAYLEFNGAEHRFSAGAGCNTLTGSFHAAKGRLKIDDAASTLMACDEEIMKQEETVSRAFSNSKSYRIKGDTLLLIDRRGRVLLKAERAQNQD
ncbi:META domain-containing protein [Neisseria sp. oral taxon 014]|uniref:META domain-containing protein n=1 Tax=Neisseria sp. oral taxon 014 TaxID=641148 RepID=UPI0025F0B30D|nr:META domain-containing protein [Neisseria sp. oral taxon 014]